MNTIKIGVGLGIGLGCALSFYMYRRRTKRTANNNIISIIPSNSINDVTFVQFVKNYQKADKDKDIHIIIHSTGGSLSRSEAICNCILNHKSQYQSKIIAYVPYYAYSGGAMIALTCDEITMLPYSHMSPCDAQIGPLDYSVSDIVNIVNDKKEIKADIDNKWLAAYNESMRTKQRQLLYAKSTIKVNDKIYEEFFSGKYSHDMLFSAQTCKDFGLNIKIVEAMPSDIKSIIDDRV